MKNYRAWCILATLFLASASLPVAAQQVDYANTTPLQYTASVEDFGAKVINWVAYGTNTPAEDQTSLMSTVSRVINTIALFVMAALAVLGGANYVIQTANKGIPGGQVISSFWMPIRISVATLLLIPLGNGYSTIQEGVIKVARTGNDHGNVLMVKGLEYVVENGVYSPVIPDSELFIKSWVQSEVCRQYVNSYQQGNFVNPSFVETSQDGLRTAAYRYNYTGKSNGVLGLDYCGSFTASLSDVTQFANQTNAAAVPAIIQDLQASVQQFHPQVVAIASEIMSDVSALRNMQSNGASYQAAYEASVAAIPGKVAASAQQIVALTNQYNNHIASVVSVKVNESVSEIRQNGEQWKDEIIRNGWPSLATAFWQIALSQRKINELAGSFVFASNPPSADNEYLEDEVMKSLSERLMAIEQHLISVPRPTNIPNGRLITISNAGADGDSNWFKSMMAKLFHNIGNVFLFDDNQDLVSSMSAAGGGITAIADVGFHTIMLTQVATKTLQETTAWTATNAANSASSTPVIGSLLGAGSTAIGAVLVGKANLIGNIGEIYGEFFKSLLIPLIFAGFILAVVLPAIPVFFWFMGVISWVIFYIECLLISPLWLSAHGTAEKEGWGSEHTRQGYMLMIGLYLNPILRVAGFFAIFSALKPLNTLAAWISSYLQGVLAAGWISPLILVGSVLVVAFFSYASAVRVFSLPNELFERGLRWVNGGQEVTGDEKAEQHNRTIIASFGHSGQSAGMRGFDRGMRGGMNGLGGRPGDPGGSTPKPV